MTGWREWSLTLSIGRSSAQTLRSGISRRGLSSFDCEGDGIVEDFRLDNDILKLVTAMAEAAYEK